MHFYIHGTVHLGLIEYLGSLPAKLGVDVYLSRTRWYETAGYAALFSLCVLLGYLAAVLLPIRKSALYVVVFTFSLWVVGLTLSASSESMRTFFFLRAQNLVSLIGGLLGYFLCKHWHSKRASS